jgi:hypothetical protein
MPRYESKLSGWALTDSVLLAQPLSYGSNRATGLAILSLASPLPAFASTGFEPQQSAMQWVAGIEPGLRFCVALPVAYW